MNDKTLKIIFYGTPEFATTILEAIHASHHEVLAVVTAPDKPAGRGRKLNQSHVKTFALENDIKILQPTNLKSAEFIKSLRELGADLQIIVAFRMLPRVVWEMPPLGTFNLHASLLPQYRGAAPINWAVINQEEFSGVTTFFIDDKIDTGAILASKKIALELDETAGSLYEKLMHLGAVLSLETIELIAAGKADPVVQKDNNDLKDAPKLDKENTILDFTQTAEQLDAHVRGLYPFPVAKAVLVNGKEMICKIYKTAIHERDHQMRAGSIVIEDKKILVACGKNMLELVELQLPNKKRMYAPALLNGFSFLADARFDAGYA